MAEAVIMPRQGQSVESCLVTAVNIKKGDNINIGDILFSYETDKSAFDEEAKFAGTVLELFIEEGDDVPCLDTVVIIGKQGDDISGLTPKNAGGAPQNHPVASRHPSTEGNDGVGRDDPGAPSIQNVVSGEIKISPRAKNYAEKARVDFKYATPTGPNGRIIERDIIELVNRGERFAGDGGKTPAAAAAPSLLKRVKKETIYIPM